MLPIDQLERLEDRHAALTRLLGDREVVTQPDRLREVSQEQSDLDPVVSTYRAFRDVNHAIADTEAMRGAEADPELAAMVEAEMATLVARRAELESRLEELLVPVDPRDARSVIVEIRAGTGGDEAGLFAADLFRLYARFAEAHGFKVDLLSQNQTGIGGFKEVIFEVRGRGAYSRLKWESGVHRVQRVPETESQGRIHTSTATVAVLPEMEEIEIAIPDSDVRVDVFRSSGPGGQSVNTTDSAVRLTHVPTGIVISCQDEKSQLQNRRKAFQVLRARLYQVEEDRRLAELGAERRGQVGTGDRAEKIRTYNFPQSRVTDHRIGLTSYRLEGILAGDLDEFIDALSTADRTARLAAARDGEG